MPDVIDDPQWIRPKAEGSLGPWHMPAGHGPHGILTACDRTLSGEAELEERPEDAIQLDERCPVCQEVHAATTGA